MPVVSQHYLVHLLRFLIPWAFSRPKYLNLQAPCELVWFWFLALSTHYAPGSPVEQLKPMTLGLILWDRSGVGLRQHFLLKFETYSWLWNCFNCPYIEHYWCSCLDPLPHMTMPDKIVVVNDVDNNGLCPKIFYSQCLHMFTQVTACRLELPP